MDEQFWWCEGDCSEGPHAAIFFKKERTRETENVE